MNYLNNFSHIYIEDKAKEYPLTKEILNKLPNSKIISIKHYKDVFNRYNQNYREQKNSMKLILALKEDKFLYEGSNLIQNQGYKNFFYTPIMLNCIYDCHYCFLQGMYPSANIVLFVNIEDFFISVKDKLKELDLKKEEMFLSISYDTDLLATEKLFSITKKWIEFAQKFNNLKLEVRTKSINYNSISNLKSSKNIYINWTLSPQIIIEKYEDKTPNLQARIKDLKRAINDGWSIAIVIDPILKIDNWQNIYRDFIIELFNEIESNKIDIVILGVFRISNSYLKKIKKSNLESDIIYYPYNIDNNIATYEDENELINFVETELIKFIDENRVITF